MSTKIYFLKDNTDNWSPVHDYLTGFVSDERRAKINRYKFKSDKSNISLFKLRKELRRKNI